MYTGDACGTCAEGYVRAPVGLDGGTSPCVKCDGGCNGRGACAAASAGSAAAAVGDGVCVCEGPFGGSRCEIYDTTFKCGRGERPVRVIVCQWSRMRPVLSANGHSLLTALAGPRGVTATRCAWPPAVGYVPLANS